MKSIEYKQYKTAKLKDKAKLTWRENVLEAGKSPIVLDSFQTKVSREQIQKYMFSKGLFYTKVTDSVKTVEYKKALFFKYKKKRAYVYYKVSKSNRTL